MSNFKFLQSEYPKLYSLGELAEKSLYFDPANTLAKQNIIAKKIINVFVT